MTQKEKYIYVLLFMTFMIGFGMSDNRTETALFFIAIFLFNILLNTEQCKK
jgi:uncharacterized membrane protein YeiB